MLAQCLLAALHGPDAEDGVPAYVGAMVLAEGLQDIRLLRKVYVQSK